MKAPPLAKNYKCLTPEERFRLILAASGRGDEAEAARLVNAGGKITLSMPDHAPFAQAFNDLALLTFIELVDEAARYQAALAFNDDVRDTYEADEAEEESDDAAEEKDAAADEEDASQEPICFRTLDISLRCRLHAADESQRLEAILRALERPALFGLGNTSRFRPPPSSSSHGGEGRICSRGISAVAQSPSPERRAGVDRCSVIRRGGSRRD